MRVLIAEDHSLTRNSVRQIVEGIKEVEAVDEAIDGPEALQKVKSNNYGFIVLDLSLPGIGGLEILKTIKDKCIKARILVLSFHQEDLYGIRAIRLGANGFVSKSAPFDEIKNAIIKVAEGGKYVSPDLAEALIFGHNEENKLPHENLSEREFQIFILLAKGMTISEIASKIFISPKTASTYKSRLFKKIDFKNITELMLYAINNKLVE